MAAGFAVPETPHPGDALRDALLVLLTFALAMAAAWGLKTYLEQRATSYAAPGGSLTLAYPAGWVAARGDKGTLLEVSDAGSGAAFRPRFAVQTEAIAENTALREAAGLLSLRRSGVLREYRELGSHEVTVSGQRGVAVTYAYVADPPEGMGRATLPIVVQATDVETISGGTLYIFTTASDAGDATAYGPAFDRILASIRVRSTP